MKNVLRHGREKNIARVANTSFDAKLAPQCTFPIPYGPRGGGVQIGEARDKHAATWNLHLWWILCQRSIVGVVADCILYRSKYYKRFRVG